MIPVSILYAEDDPMDMELTIQHFRDVAPHITIKPAASAQDCLRALRNDRYDALLLDQHLPDFDGIDLLRLLRRDYPHLPVVLVTGVGDEDLVVKALRSGACDYVAKSREYMPTLVHTVQQVTSDEYVQRVRAHSILPRHRNVLYVEPNPMDVEMTQRHLEETAPHLSLTVVATCSQAIDLVNAGNDYDVVLADLRVSDGSALDLFQHFKAQDKEFPFVIITGRGDEDTAIAAMKLGAYDYIVKQSSYIAQLPYIIENAALLHELRHTTHDLMTAYDATLAGWGKALELRDPGTDGHTHRVTEMTVKLAEAVGIRDTEHIRRGASLHDIGKIGIPDSVLLKPAKLSEDDWAIMRQHPAHAYEWLSSIDFLKPSLAIPKHHHERWDGTGYPDGLKGEEIPREARLFAVIDVWDALTSDRPYRPAWSNREAADYLRKNAGTHFDPDAVDAFLAVFADLVSAQ